MGGGLNKTNLFWRGRQRHNKITLYQTLRSFWESELVIEIPTLEYQYFDVIWGFPHVDFGQKDKGRK